MKKLINIGQIRNKIMSIAPILLLLFPYFNLMNADTISISIITTMNIMEVICTMPNAKFLSKGILRCHIHLNPVQRKVVQVLLINVNK